MSLLRKRLFRSILRIGKRFDQNPHFKLFIYSNEIKFGSDIDYYHRCEVYLDDTEKAMKTLIESYCSGNQTNSTAMLYKPNVQSSLSEFIKHHYRHQHFNALNNAQLDELGLLSIRILFKSLKLATVLTNDRLSRIPQHMDDNNAKQNKSNDINNPLKIFHEVTNLQQGVLLVSHPLWLRRYLSHSIMFILSHRSYDDQTVGFLLNKLYRNKIKDRFKNVKRSDLKAFKDFPCYHGGPNKFPNRKSFAVVHCIDKLANISEKIILPTINSKSMINLSVSESNNSGDYPVTSSESSSVGTLISAVDATSLHAQMDATCVSDTNTHLSSNSYMYITHDLRAVSKELTDGTIQANDIKIIHGCYVLEEADVQADINDNKYFMVTSDYSKDVIMCNRQRLHAEDHSHLEDPLKWRSGFHTWSKVLRLLGGEYSAFSHIKQIPLLENADIYYEELNQHPKYGQYNPVVDNERENEDGDYDDDDDDDEDDEYEIASIQDDDGLVYLAVEDDFDDVDDE